MKRRHVLNKYYDLCLVQHLNYKIKVVEKVKKHEFEQRTMLLNINTKWA